MKLCAISMCLGLMLTAGAATLAQDNDTSKPKAKVLSITGCLSHGDGADKYVLKGKNGSTWDLKGDKVALSDHVGHTVTATGTVSNSTMRNMKEDAKDTAKDSGMKKENAKSGDLEVTSIKMVSKSCT